MNSLIEGTGIFFKFMNFKQPLAILCMWLSHTSQICACLANFFKIANHVLLCWYEFGTNPFTYAHSILIFLFTNPEMKQKVYSFCSVNLCVNYKQFFGTPYKAEFLISCAVVLSQCRVTQVLRFYQKKKNSFRRSRTQRKHFATQ